MGSIDRRIMVVRRSLLLARPLQGFIGPDTHDYASVIRTHSEYLPRSEMEHDETYKQPIPYAIVMHDKSQKIFCFQRATKDAHYKEKRLQGKWSIGLGGHVDEPDSASPDPLAAAVTRELREEIGLGECPCTVLGYINDDSNEVGRVHFGILYVCHAKSLDLRPTDAEIQDYGWKSVEDFARMCDDPQANIEDWSKIAAQAITQRAPNRHQ